MNRIVVGLILAASAVSCHGQDDWPPKAALMNVVSHSLAKSLAGTDYIALSRKRWSADQAPIHIPLCGASHTAANFLRQDCVAFEVVASKEYCAETSRCTTIRLPIFVEEDPGLITSVAVGLAQPCAVLPDPNTLPRALQRTLTPGMVQAPAVDWDSLKCAGSSKVAAKMARQPNGVWVIRF